MADWDKRTVKIGVMDVKKLLDVVDDYIMPSLKSQDLKLLLEDALLPFTAKLEKLNTRDSYTRLVKAQKSGDDGKTFEARADYLARRNGVYSGDKPLFNAGESAEKNDKN